MTSSFKKGQLVAVRDKADGIWYLWIYDHASPEGAHFCRSPNRMLAPQWWREARPAETVWPEIFLGQHNKAYTKAIDKLNAQIEWLCSNLAGALNEGKLCPPNARCDGRVECEDCWSFAAEIATEETCPQ